MFQPLHFIAAQTEAHGSPGRADLERAGLCLAFRLSTCGASGLGHAAGGPGPLSRHVSSNDSTASFTEGTRCKILSRGLAWRKNMIHDSSSDFPGTQAQLGDGKAGFVLGSLTLNQCSSHDLP